MLKIYDTCYGYINLPNRNKKSYYCAECDEFHNLVAEINDEDVFEVCAFINSNPYGIKFADILKCRKEMNKPYSEEEWEFFKLNIN